MTQSLPARPDLWTLDPAVLHLNHGSFGAVPRRTQETAAALRAETEADPMAWFRRLPDRLASSRRALAGYLRTDPDGLVMVRNASAGITVALSTVPIGGGGRIVLTDHVYGAVRIAAERIARLRRAEVVTVAVPLESTADEAIDAFAAAVDERTAVVVVDQISSETAAVFPAAEVVALCRQAGVPVIVDGAHAPGLLDEPVVDGADFWTGNFHKWPCAPRGTAALTVADRWRSRALPLIASWAEHDPMPERFDWQATDDYVGWVAAPVSLEVLAELDWPRRRAELSAMLDETATQVAKSVGTTPPDVASPAPTMRLVELPVSWPRGDHAAGDAFKTRAAQEIGASLTVTAHGDRRYLRLSAHAYNAPRDYELLAARLPALL